MFLGRELELAELSAELKTKKKSAILVYGKRRIGKSSLIEQAAKSFDGIVVSHLFSRTSYEGNLALLCRSVMAALNFPSTTSFDTIFDLFDFVQKQKKRILFVLDEYQYFKESRKNGEVDSYMQGIVDSIPNNIKIIFCGSYISVMKELLQEDNPLFGRFTKILRIEEFDYLDAVRFYPGLSVREKIRFYSVFGGSPYVLANLDYKKPLEENIKKNLISQDSLLRSYIENIMLREIQKNYDVRILEAIGNGKKRYNEIQNLVGMNDSGLLDKQLKNLMGMETVEKVFPINKPKDKKKQFYEIKDNLMRFYFTFIFANEALISKFGQAVFFENIIAPALNTFVSYRFEGIANQYFKRLAQKGKLRGVTDFGSYWYDDPKKGMNGQFDCVLKDAGGYDFYEVKFYEKPMPRSECESEEKEVRALVEPNCKKIGFVCSSGFSFKSKEYNLISGKEIYDKDLL